MPHGINHAPAAAQPQAQDRMPDCLTRLTRWSSLARAVDRRNDAGHRVGLSRPTSVVQRRIPAGLEKGRDGVRASFRLDILEGLVYLAGFLEMPRSRRHMAYQATEGGIWPK